MKASKEIDWWFVLPFRLAALLAWGAIFLVYALLTLSPFVAAIFLLAWVSG